VAFSSQNILTPLRFSPILALEKSSQKDHLVLPDGPQKVTFK
jgi:hypothetical protein